MNIFIEGIQGTGKSTLLEVLLNIKRKYNAYFEGDYSPLDLAKNAYMNLEQYEELLSKFPLYKSGILNSTTVENEMYIIFYTKVRTNNVLFIKYCEQFEIYGGRISFEEFKRIVYTRLSKLKGNNIFECALFQNIIDELVLFK